MDSTNVKATVMTNTGTVCVKHGDLMGIFITKELNADASLPSFAHDGTEEGKKLALEQKAEAAFERALYDAALPFTLLAGKFAEEDGKTVEDWKHISSYRSMVEALDASRDVLDYPLVFIEFGGIRIGKGNFHVLEQDLTK